MFKNIPLLLFAFSYFLFSCHVQAQYSTEQDLLDAFELHEKITKVNNTQKVKDLQPFIDMATKNNWQKAWVKIQTSKATLYSDLYQLKNLQRVIQKTLPIAKKLKLFDEIVALETHRLSASRFSKSITANISAESILTKLPNMKDSHLENIVRLSLAHYLYYTEDLLTSLQLILDLNDDTEWLKARKAGRLADIYYRVGDMEKYDKYTNQAIILSENIDDLSGKAILMYNRLSYLFLDNNFEEIKRYLPLFEQAVEMAGDVTLLGDVYRYKGMLALHQNDYPLAKYFLNESKKTYQTYNLDIFVMLSDLVLLKVILVEGDFSSAKEKLLTIKSDVLSQGDPEELYDYYKMSTTIYQTLNDYKSALISEKSTKTYALILSKAKNQAEIIKFEYEQSLKNKVVEQAHMQEKQAQQNIIWLLIIIVALLIVSLLIIVLYKQMNAKQKLNVIANTDVLTGAPNRRAILNSAEQQLKYCEEKQLPLTIVIADIDLFKSINDEFGHNVGDVVLRLFSDCSKQAIRQSEFYGRFGGEEWLFVLPQTKVTFAQTLFERLNKTIEKHGDEVPFDYKRLTFSMGAVDFNQGDTVKSMIDRADKLLYQAKKKGRNRICY